MKSEAEGPRASDSLGPAGVVLPPLWFDTSARSRLLLTGRDGQDLLQRLSTNDLRSLEVGQARNTLLLERSGRLVDRIVVARLGADELLLLTNAGRGTAVREWIEKLIILEDAALTDRTRDTAEVTILFGRNAMDLGRPAKNVTFPFPDGVPAAVFTLHSGEVFRDDARSLTFVRRTDLPGDGITVVGSAEEIARFRESWGADQRGDLSEMGRREVLFGVAAWGSEIDERSLPLELGLESEISFTKGCYIGQEVIARVHNYKRVRRRLCRIFIEGDRELSPEGEIALPTPEPQTIGRISRAVRAEGAKAAAGAEGAAGAVEGWIALAQVVPGNETPGTVLEFVEGNQRRAARVLTLHPEGDV